MAITYKSVIALAIAHFNDIQSELYTLGAKRADGTTGLTAPSSSGSLVPTDEFDTIIKNQLQLKAAGNIELTAQTGTDVKQYATASVRSAAGYSVSYTDNSANAVTVGSLVDSEYYALTSTLESTLTAGTPGWFTTGSASAEAKVGKIKKGSLSALTSAESGSDLVITSTYNTGYLDSTHKDATKTMTINAATFKVTNGTEATFVFGKNTSQINGSTTNISGIATIKNGDEGTPTSGYVIPVTVKASSSGSIKSETAGYIPANTLIDNVSTDDTATAYVSIQAAEGEVTVTEFEGSKDLTQNVVKDITASSNNSSTNVTETLVEANLASANPTSGYYIAVKNEATTSTLTATADANIKTEGYIPDTYDFGAQPISIKVDADEKTTYIPLKTGSCTVSGGTLSWDKETFKPNVTLGIDSSSKTIKAGLTDTAQTSGFYVKLNGTSAAGAFDISRSAIQTKHTEGYIPAHDLETYLGLGLSEKTLTVEGGAKDYYLTIPSATFAASATENTDYTLDNNLVLSYEEGGTFLYVNEGYTSNKKFNLGKLLPDIEQDALASHILAGFEAYNEDGTIIHGTIGNATFSPDYYTDTNTGLGGLNGGSYIPEDRYIIAGDATLSTDAPDAITPTITKVTTAGTGSSTNIQGVTGELTVDPPTSGYYFAVESSEESSTASASMAITTGWVDTSKSDSKPITFNVNKATAYIPVDAATVAPAVVDYTAPTVAISTTSAQTTTTETAYSITISSSETKGGVKAKYNTTASGYIPQGDTKTSDNQVIDPVVKFNNTEKNVEILYIKDGSVSGGELVLPTTTVSPSALKQEGKVTTSTSDYVKFTVSAQKVSITEGYVVESEGFTPASQEVKVAAASPGIIENGTPTVTFNVSTDSNNQVEVTQYSEETGSISKASSKQKVVNIASVEVISSGSYQDTYMVNGIGAKTAVGTATANIPNDTTGEDVDEYVESLYKRILGKTYTEVAPD